MAVTLETREEAKEAARKIMARLLADSRVADDTADARRMAHRSFLDVPHLPIEDESLLAQIIDRNGFQKVFNSLTFAVVAQEFALEAVAEALQAHGEAEHTSIIEEAELWRKFRTVMALLLVPRVTTHSPINVEGDPKTEACRAVNRALDEIPKGYFAGEWDEDDLRAELHSD